MNGLNCLKDLSDRIRALIKTTRKVSMNDQVKIARFNFSLSKGRGEPKLCS